MNSSPPAGTAYSAWAVCLCAQWCATCREYQPAFEALAARFPAVRFVWLDVEDQADIVGDYDVQTFPTLLLAHAGGVQFAGPVLPQISVLERLLQRLDDNDGSSGGGASHLGDSEAMQQAHALWQRLEKS